MSWIFRDPLGGGRNLQRGRLINDLLRPHQSSHEQRDRTSGRRAQRQCFTNSSSGAYYEVSDRELEILQSDRYDTSLRPLPRPISLEDAARRLFQRHERQNRARKEDAWDRIQDAFNELPSWHLYVKMFNDLDTIVFHGNLRHRVHFRWEEVRRNTGNNALAFTETPEHANGDRIAIVMSSDTDWRHHTLEDGMGVLLHEMLHAYFYIWCRNDVDEDVDDGLRNHGPIFMACARRIGRKMQAETTKIPAAISAEMAAEDMRGGGGGFRPACPVHDSNRPPDMGAFRGYHGSWKGGMPMGPWGGFGMW